MGFFDPKCKGCGKKVKKLALQNGYCTDCLNVPSIQTNVQTSDTGLNMNDAIADFLGKPLEQVTDDDFSRKLYDLAQIDPPNASNKELELKISGKSLSCRTYAVSPKKQFQVLLGCNYVGGKNYLIVMSKECVVFKKLISNELERAYIIDDGSFCITETGFNDKAGHMTNRLSYFDSSFTKKKLYSFDYDSDSLALSKDGNIACIKALGETRFYDTSTGKLLTESILNKEDDAEESANPFDNPLDKFGKSILDIDLGKINYNGYDIYHKISAEINTGIDSLSPEHTQKYIELLVICFDTKLTDNTYALILKLMGDLYLHIDGKANALRAYKLAIGRNPKIGLKRKITALEKELQ